MQESPRPDGVRTVRDPLQRIGRDASLGRGTWASLTEVFGRRELLGRLISREISAKYKNSSLGVVWSLMRPLAQLVIYFVAIGQFLGAARSIPEFAIFVFTGLTAWSLYSEIISAGTTSIVANGGLVKKVYLPREIFPLAAVGAALFNFVIQFGILVLATAVLGQFPWHADLGYLPLSIAIILVYATAIALVLSALNVYLRDVQHLVEILLLILFWASPIVYSAGFVHEAIGGTWIEQLYLANPITLAVLGMQKAMWLAGTTDPEQYWPPNLALDMGIALIVGIVLLWIGQRIFSRLQSNFAQEL
ncbi:ABC transporter permease [Agromyces sp. CFH 90414]|uniref:Transport permease protein n=1 Tax=Agromyces agglutinans TaxID=2662258 RepID=A0A6I2F714_9MICO|nr:ABC transporter permease [Agromyces agglutinans]MRG60552.1 ABC transporter permease [Agromyces agglutinans]